MIGKKQSGVDTTVLQDAIHKAVTEALGPMQTPPPPRCGWCQQLHPTPAEAQAIVEEAGYAEVAPGQWQRPMPQLSDEERANLPRCQHPVPGEILPLAEAALEARRCSVPRQYVLAASYSDAEIRKMLTPPPPPPAKKGVEQPPPPPQADPMREPSNYTHIKRLREWSQTTVITRCHSCGAWPKGKQPPADVLAQAEGVALVS